MVRREYSDEIKAQVMAALLAGQAVSLVAKEYAIPKRTVAHWKNTAIAKVQSDGTKKSDGPTLDQLLRAYADTNLVTLREQSVFFRDPKWLHRQSASELAVLHGVIADKTIRILEAWGNAQADESDEVG